MELQRVLDSLRVGELSQTAYVDEATNVIPEDKYPSVINSINLALMSIYTFFNIREKELYIQQMEGRTEYPLDPLYAVSNTTSTEDKFIIDTIDKPFTGDIMRVNQVYNEYGEAMPVNDFDDPDSVFLPDFNLLQCPFPKSTHTISLMYTAKPDPIALDETDTTTDLLIPDTLLESLILYTAGRLMGALTTQDSQVRSQQLMQMYYAEVTRLQQLNLYNTGDSSSNQKLEMRGFV